jgi:23S rRNA pseudouridine2605 synthase
MARDLPQRLQKALAQLGLGSRREVESWIRAGRLSVNGATAVLGTRVRDSDQIRLDGRLVRRQPTAGRQVFVCHRSPGEPLDRLEGAPRSPSERLSLLERLPRVGGRRFIAVSPMPLNDGGLELVTSDGELAATLQRVAHELTTEFSVRTHGELGENQLAGVESGQLDGAQLEVIGCSPAGGEGVSRWYSVVIRGARGSDVRHLFERSGARVSRVLRTRLGSVALDRALARGQFRKLAHGELDRLLAGAAGQSDAGIARTSSATRAKPTARRSSGRSRRDRPGRAARDTDRSATAAAEGSRDPRPDRPAGASRYARVRGSGRSRGRT